MPTDLITQMAPFLSKTTAIMSAVILLTIIAAIMVSVERKINRGTIEKLLVMIKSTIRLLIYLEFFLGFIELVKFVLRIYTVKGV